MQVAHFIKNFTGTEAWSSFVSAQLRTLRLPPPQPQKGQFTFLYSHKGTTYLVMSYQVLGASQVGQW